jgi:hypothetical protein
MSAAGGNGAARAQGASSTLLDPANEIATDALSSAKANPILTGSAYALVPIVANLKSGVGKQVLRVA